MDTSTTMGFDIGTLGDSSWYYYSFIFIIPILISLTFIVVYRIFLHPLAAVPGPWPAKVTGFYRTYLYWRGTFHDDIVNLHKKYGKVVRINANEVSTVDAVSLRQVYGFGKQNARKHKFYEAFQLDYADVFDSTDPAIHAVIRKRLSNAYAMTSIISYEPYMQSVLDICWSKIREHIASSKEPIDMSEWTHRLAFDFISELVCGQSMGHLSQGGDVDNVRKNINSITKLVVLLGDIPTQTAIFTHPLSKFIQTRVLRLKSPVETFMRFSADRVRDRVTGRSGVGRNDMLTQFTNAKPTVEPTTSETIEREIIRDVRTAFGAGADTTSISMRAVIIYLGLNPDIYKRLQKDIDNFYTANGLGALEPLTFTQSQQIPLLRAVVAESVRLVPAICGQLLRVSPGVTIDKYWIPRGTTIGMSAMAVNKDPSIFGNDTEKFRPDRWLESPNTFARLDNMSMTFGAGARGCIGKNIALVEIQKFTAQFYRFFEVELVDKETPWKNEFFMTVNPKDVRVRLKERYV